MKRIVVAVAILLAAACTGDLPPSGKASDARESPAATPQPSTADLPLSAVNFACKLPVLTSSSGGDYGQFQGGFVTFPLATFESDPAGVIHSRYPDGDWVTSSAPNLYGSGRGFYDLAQKRWVPVDSPQSSRDGAFYAFGVVSPESLPNQPVIRVVDVAHATTRLFPVTNQSLGSTIGVRVTDFDGSNVYFTSVQNQGLPLGVWKLNITTGPVRELSHVSGVALVRGGYAWLDRVDPRDPAPLQVGRPLESNSTVRLDLATGRETVWYYAPGHGVFILGLDGHGKPIIRSGSNPFVEQSSVLVVPSPGDPGVLVYGGGQRLSDPQPDGDRIWFGGVRAIYLYTPTEGLRRVFDFTGEATVVPIIPVGFCR